MCATNMTHIFWSEACIVFIFEPFSLTLWCDAKKGGGGSGVFCCWRERGTASLAGGQNARASLSSINAAPPHHDAAPQKHIYVQSMAKQNIHF